MKTINETSRVRTLLEPVTDRLERIENAQIPDREELDRMLAAARTAGLTGLRYGLIAALAVASPKDAIKQLLGYVEEAERGAEDDNPTAALEDGSDAADDV